MTQKNANLSLTMFGVMVAVAGTVVTALGNHLIVQGHNFTKKGQTRLGNSYLLGGNLCVVALGTSLGLIGLAYAPQSLISPLGGLTVIWNLLFATLPVFGGVRPKAEEIVYTLITLAGMMLVVYMGPQSRDEPSSFLSLTRMPFIFIMSSYVGLIAYMSVAKTENKLLRRIYKGCICALVGGLSNVFAKSAVEFSSGKQVPNEASDYVTWGLVVAIALILALTQLLLLNSALAQFSAVQVIPIYQTALCIAATMSGGIAFDEFRGMSLFQLLSFSVGVFVAILGVLLSALASSHSSTTDQEKD